MLHAVIMAGGSGTRFWPMSRQARPKHLLELAGSESLIQQTVRRIASIVPAERTWVITAEDQASAIREQLPELAYGSTIGEPCKRDTAPCIGLAASLVSLSDPDGIMVVMPADHVIEPDTDFCRIIELAAKLIDEDTSRLVTLGIKPTRAATGYGYIHRGEPVGAAPPAGAHVFRVRSFREKPAHELAEQFVASGDFYWNSGIFIWSARTISEQLRRSRPKMAAALERVAAAWNGPERDSVFASEYRDIERISIDYAVMEKANNILVVEAAFRWDDVGSWQALERLRGSTPEGNTIIGRHCGIDTRSCIVASDSNRLVATLGVEHLIIVQSGNATLVADRRQEESVKRLVELMRERGLDQFL